MFRIPTRSLADLDSGDENREFLVLLFSFAAGTDVLGNTRYIGGKDF
jgi:hypothetical protein